ncbi:hypothetical protein ACIQRC_34800 [Streptomyces californicus]|uniref:hypothetical protein n=1 Tax=Streptomyces californicus TaxID=67351 RepID=UPI00382A40CA
MRDSVNQAVRSSRCGAAVGGLMVVRPARSGGDALQRPRPGQLARPDLLLGRRLRAERTEGLAAVGEALLRFPEPLAVLPFGGGLGFGAGVLLSGPGGPSASPRITLRTSSGLEAASGPEASCSS